MCSIRSQFLKARTHVPNINHILKLIPIQKSIYALFPENMLTQESTSIFV